MFKLPMWELDRSLRKLYRQKFKETSEGLRDQLLDSSKLYPELFDQVDWTNLHVKVVKLNHKVALAVMSWYMPEEVRFLLHFWLQEHWGGESKEVMDVVLTSKDYALAYLCIQESWSERDFFGNVLDSHLSKLWSMTAFRRLSQRPVKRYTGYCRGYQESNRSASRGLGELAVGVLTVGEFHQRELRQALKLRTLIARVQEFLAA